VGNGILHVLIVTGGGVGLVGGDVKLVADLDGDVGITNGVTSTDLGALGVKGDGQRTASLDTSSLTGVVDNRLVVLIARSIGLSFDVHLTDKVLTS
jgi:hypothetical protein